MLPHPHAPAAATVLIFSKEFHSSHSHGLAGLAVVFSSSLETARGLSAKGRCPRLKKLQVRKLEAMCPKGEVISSENEWPSAGASAKLTPCVAYFFCTLL